MQAQLFFSLFTGLFAVPRESFAFPLSGIRPIVWNRLKALCASTALFFAFYRLIRSAAGKLRFPTVGHSPYRMKPSKSALCKHSSFFRFHTALLIAYAHYNIFSVCFYWIGGWLWGNYRFFIQECGLICCNKFTLVILCFFWYTNVIMLGKNPQL